MESKCQKVLYYDVYIWLQFFYVADYELVEDGLKWFQARSCEGLSQDTTTLVSIKE